MDELNCTNCTNDVEDKILKCKPEQRKTDEKQKFEGLNRREIERFLEEFNKKKRDIEGELELLEKTDREYLYSHIKKINEYIQELQEFYSAATIFLRVYDKRVCQDVLHKLQMGLKDVENSRISKKKFGFKTRRNKVEAFHAENVKKSHPLIKIDKTEQEDFCGFRERKNEILILKGEDIEKKDVLLSDLKDSCIKLYGNPSTLHIANLINCQVYSGPVTTSVLVQNVKNSSLHLACQQLRIHETTDTDFCVHVTSKAIIEDSQNVRFGVYELSYDGIDEHYKLSGLNRSINNWDKVDDFNWLAIDKPSPNWSKLLT